ncbi:hypothetical protein MQE36_01595 [Zhouia spongiae]|uniref:Uncharacterized protein n=1 Tax=Zhouia spongiae TaxID=2202721 RepID=A0ABY3YN63_9FLAO|nr:hypothetical protein [Zhouia spongiae]UNY99055.1 hypothetical protein MQE36_01595 [Zhouia spongiae]
MKKINYNNFIMAILAVFCYKCNAQVRDTTCYKKAKGFIENKLPDGICIKKHELIYDFFDNIDFNNDRISDVAIEVGNDGLKNGDQTILVVYRSINDTTYSKFKELDNVYPIWFDNYSRNIELEDPKLNAIKEKYEGRNPLRKLEMVNNRIILNLKYDVGYEYIYEFTFNNEKQDWLLSKYIIWDLNENIKSEEDNGYLNTSVSEFNYFKFITGEY